MPLTKKSASSPDFHVASPFSLMNEREAPERKLSITSSATFESDVSTNGLVGSSVHIRPNSSEKKAKRRKQRKSQSSAKSVCSSSSFRSRKSCPQPKARYPFEFAYDDVNVVVSTWESARERAGNESVGCELLRRLFVLEPKMKDGFGIPANADLEKDDLHRMAFLSHALNTVQVIDGILSLLGPETAALRNVLIVRTKQHVKDGMEPHHIPYGMKALLDVLKGVLGEDWKANVEEAWVRILLPIGEAVMNKIIEMKTPL